MDAELLYNIQSILNFYVLSPFTSFIAIFFPTQDHSLPLVSTSP